MKKQSLFILALAMSLTFACKSDKKEDAVEEQEMEQNETTPATQTSETKKVTVRLELKSNRKASGNVVFTETDGRVKMVAIVGGLPEGKHAIHIHENADCSAEDGSSAGGHWNPTAQPHGKWGADSGYHKGDIGNFTASPTGNGTITKITPEWCIGCGDPNKDILGKSVIVHESVDDFTSQPSGAAGSRISCGGIIQ